MTYNADEILRLKYNECLSEGNKKAAASLLHARLYLDGMYEKGWPRNGAK